MIFYSADNERKLPVFTSEPHPPLLRTIGKINQWIEVNYALFFDGEIYGK